MVGRVGEVTLLQRNNGLTTMSWIGFTNYGYDGPGNVTNVTYLKFSGGPPMVLRAVTYTYDAISRLTNKNDGGTSITYTYDTTNQLTNDGSATNSYDANVNRTMTGYSTTANEITTDGTWNYTYDNEGNRTKMVSIATGATWKFSYDNHNELTAANYYSSDGGTLLAWVSYKNDALGHLIERDVSAGAQNQPVMGA